MRIRMLEMIIPHGLLIRSPVIGLGAEELLCAFSVHGGVCLVEFLFL